MAVVSDTSPLTNLAIINRLDLVWEQFGEITIPKAVSRELSRLEHVKARGAILEARHDGWLTTRALSQRVMADALAGQLDLGEAEAIALACEAGANWLLMDERDGRRVAAQAGLNVVGVLGILMRAKANGRIASLQDEVQRSKSEAHFHL